MPRPLFLVFLALSVLLGGVCDGTPASGAPVEQTMVFILDASGSMWGKAAGVTKIETAKQVLSKVLGEVPDSCNVGLVAFGHRTKADCRDIEVLVPPQVGAAGAAIDLLAKINPKGKTPIAATLALMGEQLKGREQETSLVLVSDGIETCGGDPCKTAEALRAQGIKVVIHVVGFGVAGNEEDQLKCIAEAGGGRYFSVQTGNQLAAALTAVREHVVAAAPLPEPQAPPAPPQVQDTQAQSKRVKIAGPGTVELRPASWVVMPPHSWSLADPETGEAVARGQALSQPVKAGSYQILWRQSEHGGGDVALSEVVTVASGETVRVAIDTGIRITLPEGMKPPYAFRLVDAERNTVAGFSGQLGPEVVPAGTYHLIWRQTEHGHEDLDLGPITLASGRLNDLVLNSGIVVALPQWLPAPYFYQLTDAAKHRFKIREPGPQLVAPGTYRLTWRQSEHGHSDVDWGEVTVAQDQLTRLEISSGITFLAGSAPPPYRIYVVDKAGGKKAEMAESWGPMPLPPGTYQVDMWQTQHGSSRTTLIEDLVVEPGQLVEIEF